MAPGPPPVEEFLSLESWRRDSPYLRGWRSITRPFERLFAANLSLVEWTYWLCCALWSLVVWAFFGGAITRIAAVGFARQENAPWREVGGFVRPKWFSYFGAPLMPMVATFMGAALLALVGLLLRSEIGILIAGIIWPLVLLGGFVMAFLLIGLYFCWPLMWSAISAEGTDAFGALSHAYSYAYQRPLRYLWYGVLAALIGVLGWFLVATFAQYTIALSAWGVSWGAGDVVLVDSEDLGQLGDFGVRLSQFWTNCLTTLVVAFVFSYFWVASTVIYFLLRRLVDASELDEVYLVGENQPQHGLPPLRTGEDGVAEPADEPKPGNSGDGQTREEP